MKKPERDESRKQIIHLYTVERRAIAYIAKQFGVSRQTIHVRLVRAGVAIRVRNFDHLKRSLDRATLIQLYMNDRLSVHKIAKILATDSYIVVRELDRHKIKRRPKNAEHRQPTPLDELKIGDSAVVSPPNYRTRYSYVYGRAATRKIKVSIRKMDADRLRVTRIG